MATQTPLLLAQHVPGNDKYINIFWGTGLFGAEFVRVLAEKYPKCAITVVDRIPRRIWLYFWWTYPSCKSMS
ncbi:hypothetical protein N7495_008371 [Penicillium taxi]|uniref:uncharacterized protein n=1 Tax=Penicillium taxi TaxID=168475 RepID=UPI00254555C7|nr:uncharacterized protein N7495_008371 [Penicillium taxi]KAJ5888330.1 hypothetical protein N7495_008371 [Penicillium taxi]